MIFIIENNKLIRTKNLGTDTDIIIPDGIKIIGKNAFNRKRIRSVYVPDSVSLIEAGTFDDCDVLESIRLSNRIKIIEMITFNGCINLKKVIFPESLEVIRKRAFADCKNLSNIELPNSLKEIGEYAFLNCENIETLNLPDRLSLIGSHAFDGCTNLRNINIPSKITSVSAATFNNCINLEACQLPSGLKSINGGAFSGCIRLKDINIPHEIGNIKKDAFNKCCMIEASMFNSLINGENSIDSSFINDIIDIQINLLKNNIHESITYPEIENVMYDVSCVFETVLSVYLRKKGFVVKNGLVIIENDDLHYKEHVLLFCQNRFSELFPKELKNAIYFLVKYRNNELDNSMFSLEVVNEFVETLHDFIEWNRATEHEKHAENEKYQLKVCYCISPIQLLKEKTQEVSKSNCESYGL